MTVIIGLTGGIASGKSTVSTMFREKNYPVIDADVISREVVEPGEKAYSQIIEVFGEEIIGEDKKIDRPKLGSIIFTNDDKRKKLNEIVHPAVRERMLYKKAKYMKQEVSCIILDIPLLFESERTYQVDKTLVVYVDQSVQKKRLMERNGYSAKEADDRIASQMSLDKKAKLADAVLDNNGSIMETKAQLGELLRQWNIE